VTGKPTVLWWVLPLLFGIVGGVVASSFVEYKDKDMARKLLVFGMIWTFVLAPLYFLLVFYLFPLD